MGDRCVVDGALVTIGRTDNLKSMRPEDLYVVPRTRNSAVTCLAFGQNRKEKFPRYFFCDGCDRFEDAVLNGNRRAHRKTRYFTCTGGHEGDNSHPTTIQRMYRPSKNKEDPSTPMVDVDSSSSSDDDVGAERRCTNKKMPRPACAGKYTTPRARKTHTKSSPTESPLKKRLRRSARQQPCYDNEESSSAGNEDEVGEEDATMHQRFGKALSFLDADNNGHGNTAEEQVLDGEAGVQDDDFVADEVMDADDDDGHDDTAEEHVLDGEAGVQDDDFVADEVMEYITNIEKSNAMLTERLYEMELTFSLQIAALEAEIVGLKAKLATEDVTASACSSTAPFHTTSGAVENDEDDEMESDVDDSKTYYQRRKRINTEDTEVSQILSGIILRFFMTSEVTANKRRFPDCRLARIVVDSVLAFEWIRCELANTTSSVTAKLNRAMLVNETAEFQRASFDVSSLSAFMNRKLRRCTDKRKAAVLVECIWDDAFLDGEARLSMIECVRKHVRNHLFPPWKILKAMDLAGFNLSLAGIEVLRGVDCANKYSRGFLPSKSSILRAARKVEASADSLCPFNMIGRVYEEDDTTTDSDFGEGFEFDVVKTTMTLFEAFGLMADAKHRSVELGLTSDGAQLTHTLSHVCAGLKFNDIGIQNPFTKQPMLLHEPDSLVQSRNLCFPLRVVIAKDSKKTLDGFRSLYNKFNSGDVSTALGCRPFKMSYPGDMKLQWGALDKGGAAKVKEQFCYVCTCTSSSLHTPQDASNCHLCKDKDRQHNEALRCYHFKFLASPEVRGQLEEELALMTSLLDRAAAVNNNQQDHEHQRRMYVRQPGQTAVDGDKFDIDYQPTTVIDTAIFSSQVNRELASRFLNVTGPLSARQQRLREQLLIENRARELKDMLTHSEARDKAMYLVLQAVVCILHLENRVGLKSIESILRSGLSKALQGILTWTTSMGAKKRQEEYVHHVTNIMQTRILGTVSAPSQWRFPLTEDGKLGSLSMDNNRTRATVNNIEALIEVSFPDSDPNKAKLLRCFPSYRAALVILRKNTDYSDAEISMFQEHIDAWFCDWVHVYGKEGCTNYTHMLSSSHIMQYMKEWRCLHRYSQQGWEALNALLKSYFFRRTNRGGLAKNSTRKSKLLGIARWLQRRMMWYSGHGDALFNQYCDDDDDDHDHDNQEDDGEDSCTTTSDHESNDSLFDSDDNDEGGRSLMSSSSDGED